MRTQKQPTPLKPRSPFGHLPAGSLRVLQITDLHLSAEADARLLGLNTLDSLEQVLDKARATCWPADLILLTGDLAHDGSEKAYSRILERFDRFGVPVYCIAGNHDDPAVMARILNSGRLRCVDQASHGDWSIVLLDSTKPHEEGGQLTTAELQRLDSLLLEHPQRHALICLHHNPIPTESAWLDTMVLESADEFFRVLDRHPQVRGVLWGHIHQEIDTRRNGVRLLASPSTCIQFKPRQTHFAVDELPPGFRWLVLMPDGGIRTGVERLAAFSMEVDRLSAGY